MAIEFLKPFGIKISAKEAVGFASVVKPDILMQLVKKYHLVVLRDFAALPKEGLVEYAQQLGSLLEWEFGNVMEMKVHTEPANYLFTHGPVPFHWDGAFHREPRYLLFHCIDAPLKNAGGETIFTNTKQIWRKASAKEKTLWSTLRLTYQTEKKAHYGGAITVPLVQTHPDSGKTILRFAERVPKPMLNPVAVSVEDYAQEKTDQFIDDMAKRCYDEKYCYTHIWEANDFLLADNFALLHGRKAFHQFSPRHLRRIQIL